MADGGFEHQANRSIGVLSNREQALSGCEMLDFLRSMTSGSDRWSEQRLRVPSAIDESESSKTLAEVLHTLRLHRLQQSVARIRSGHLDVLEFRCQIQQLSKYSQTDTLALVPQPRFRLLVELIRGVGKG